MASPMLALAASPMATPALRSPSPLALLLPPQLPGGQVFAEDVHNVVMDYSANGHDAFYSCVASALAARDSAPGESRGSAVDESMLAAVGQGTQQLYDNLARRATASLQLFQSICTSCIFKPPVRVDATAVNSLLPPEAHLPGGGSQGSSSQGGSQEDEAALAARIEGLRQQLAQVDQRCGSLRQELQRVDRHIVSCGDTSDYAALAASALSSKQTILAIAAAAENLQNMMERAAALRSGDAAAGGGGAAAAGKLRDTQSLGGVSQASGTSLAAVTALADLVRV